MDIAALESSPNADSLVNTIMEYDLARHIVELDAYGFTVIPPEKLGTPPGFADDLREAILGVYKRRHGVEFDDHLGVNELPVANDLAWQLIDESDVITEAVLNPVCLAMARWHCGQSAVLGGTSSIIKPPAEDNWLPLHNDTHGVQPPQAAYPHLVEHELDSDGLRRSGGRANGVRAGFAPLGSAADGARVDVLARRRTGGAGADDGEGRLAGHLGREHVARGLQPSDGRSAGDDGAGVAAPVHEDDQHVERGRGVAGAFWSATRS